MKISFKKSADQKINDIINSTLTSKTKKFKFISEEKNAFKKITILNKINRITNSHNNSNEIENKKKLIYILRKNLYFIIL